LTIVSGWRIAVHSARILLDERPGWLRPGWRRKGKALIVSKPVFNLMLAATAIMLLAGNIESAHAGPPLVTDDTGIVPLGEWQFIVSAQGESRPANDSGSLPAVEVTYGFFEDMNLTAVVPRQYNKERGEPSKTDFGNAQLNYKWLFYDSDLESSEGLTLAISPIYSFPLTRTSRIRGLAEDVRVLSMPVIGSWLTGPWEFVAQASYDLASGDGSVDGVGYGIFAVYNATDSLQLMAEIYGAELSGDGFVDAGLNYDEGFANWRLGALWEMGAGYSLLAAYGGPIDSDLPSDQKLDYDFFLGLQYDTE
jgi:hypothetical protein